MPRIHSRDLTIASVVYLFFLFGWLGVYLISGDKFFAIALMNFAALYFFIPLVLVLLVALFSRNRWLFIAFLAGVFALVMLWGDHFVPKVYEKSGDIPRLKVMTYNVYAWHDDYESILDTIHYEDPDVLFLQELNTGFAEFLTQELRGKYPYQELVPQDNPEGIGVVSKFPLSPSDTNLPQLWAGGPQILDLVWNNQKILLVNFHLTPTDGVFPIDREEQHIRAREQEARLLSGLASQVGGAIMGGDGNMSFLSDAYKEMTKHLVDAYRSMGAGLGHTSPGRSLLESELPHPVGLFIPAWLMRIDYVFHSDNLTTVSAHTAKIDGVSDHRGVVVELVINN